MGNKLRILVVEDKPLIAENLKLTLEDLGYEVAQPCYTFAAAANAISKGGIDLALLDINLGSERADENGIVLGQLISEISEIPFIFLTAYSDLETIRSATKLGPSGYLIKPVNPATVFATIQATIERTLRSQKLGAEAGDETPDFFFVKLGNSNHKVMWTDVWCIEAGKNYVKLHVAEGKMEYPIRGSMTFVLEELLPEHLQRQFIRISRSECLNIKYIITYDAQSIIAEGRQFLNTRYTLKELQALIQTSV